MEDHSITATGDHGPVPADDPQRRLTIARPDDVGQQHLSVVGDTYTVLVSGRDTNGRYCLIDMLVPAGSGPPPHRHDFEELFTLLEGELDVTFRGETRRVAAPASVNIPANAPHRFKNTSGSTVHMLCMCTPAGQDAFFTEIGTPVDNREMSAPELDEEALGRTAKLTKSLARKYRTEFVDQA